MAIFCGSVKIKKRDGSFSITVENIVISGTDIDSMKRNPTNLRRALRYMNDQALKVPKEDPLRWVIVDIILHKQLDSDVR